MRRLVPLVALAVSLTAGAAVAHDARSDQQDDPCADCVVLAPAEFGAEGDGVKRRKAKKPKDELL